MCGMGQGTVLCPTIMDSGVPGQVGRGTVPCPTHCPTRKSGTQNRPLSHAAYGEYFETYVCANDSKMMPDYKNTSGKLTFQDAQIPCIIVNEEQEKAAGVTITGWDSLLDPALTGKIAIADPTASSSAWNFLQCLLTDFGGWDNDAAWEYIEKFIPHMGQVGRGTVPCPTHCPTRKSGTQNRPLSHVSNRKNAAISIT